MLQSKIIGWRTEITALITAVKVVVVDMLGVGAAQVDDIVSHLITILGLFLAIVFRELAKKREKSADYIGSRLDEIESTLRERLEK